MHSLCTAASPNQCTTRHWLSCSPLSCSPMVPGGGRRRCVSGAAAVGPRRLVILCVRWAVAALACSNGLAASHKQGGKSQYDSSLLGLTHFCEVGRRCAGGSRLQGALLYRLLTLNRSCSAPDLAQKEGGPSTAGGAVGPFRRCVWLSYLRPSLRWPPQTHPTAGGICGCCPPETGRWVPAQLAWPCLPTLCTRSITH